MDDAMLKVVSKAIGLLRLKRDLELLEENLRESQATVAEIEMITETIQMFRARSEEWYKILLPGIGVIL